MIVERSIGRYQLYVYIINSIKELKKRFIVLLAQHPLRMLGNNDAISISFDLDDFFGIGRHFERQRQRL
jgi:hypothetical protein